jgi:hypothetical protein
VTFAKKYLRANVFRANVIEPQVPRAELRFEVLFKKFHPRINPEHDKTIFRPLKLALRA